MKIGKNTVIYKEYVEFKSDNIIIGDNCVIGGTGFQVVNNKVQEHLGKVVIEDNVEIQSGVMIDRGLNKNDKTIIGEGTKIDNLVHIAHNDIIGKNCFIVAGTSLGGSVRLGDNCFTGINSCIRPSVVLGDNCLVGMGAVVLRSFPKKSVLIGNPAKRLKRKKRHLLIRGIRKFRRIIGV